MVTLTLALTVKPVATLVPLAIGDVVDLSLPGRPIVGQVTGVSPGKLFITRDEGCDVVLPRHRLRRQEVT